MSYTGGAGQFLIHFSSRYSPFLSSLVDIRVEKDFANGLLCDISSKMRGGGFFSFFLFPFIVKPVKLYKHEHLDL